MKIALFDSHCHIDVKAFDSDREALWASCHEHNIKQLFIPGTHYEQWEKAKVISETLEGCYFGIGIHPWWIDKNNCANLETTLCQAVKQLKPQAIGECGLDKNIHTDIETQINVLKAHIQTANKYQLPLIIHSVKCHDILYKVLKQCPVAEGGIIHAFSGSKEQAEAFISLGFYLGVGGTITYPRAKKTIATIQSINLQYLVLETDAPDMPLNGFQGQDNSPLQLTRIAERLAAIKATPLNEVIETTSRNCHSLFKLCL